MIESQRWASISGYEGFYEVSENGTVRNSQTHHMLSPLERNGYFQVELSKHQKREWKLLHRIVANAFIPNKEEKSEVNHIDGNKHNNCVENLEWCTRNENLKHAFLTGLKAKDTSARKIKCTDSAGNVAMFPSIYCASKELNISKGNICMVCKGQRPLASGYKFQYE